MYNTKAPSEAELPSAAQLLRSTILAILAAAVILIALVLPAEYGIDPTGVGRRVGLTEMGEIKAQLAKEAEADRAMDQQRQTPGPSAPADKRSGLLGRIVAELLIRPAAAQTAPAARGDEMTVTLKPNQGAEIKLEMKKGQKASYAWSASGGAVNYDMHGEPDNAPDKPHSYKKGRSAGADKGVLEAAFDGNHGWFWRNRTNKDVTVTIRADGEYGAMKRVL